MFDAYWRDAVDELHVQDLAASFLSLVISRVPASSVEVEFDKAGVPTGGEDATQHLRLYALMLMGVRALRSARAARAVLAFGYESEARQHDRVLVELISHRHAVVADESGKAAFDWLKGKAGKGITAKVNAMQAEELYRNLSHDAHGDPNPVLRMMIEQGSDVDTPLIIGPVRSVSTRASLLMHAGFLRDQAVVTAQFANLELAGVERLDAEIREGWRRLEDEAGTANPGGA